MQHEWLRTMWNRNGRLLFPLGAEPAPEITDICRVPMVLHYPVAKESWKDMINIIPKDMYTPQVDYGAVVSRPHFSR